jgi:hypothetical protein
VSRVIPATPSLGNPPGAFTRGHDGYGFGTAKVGAMIHGRVDENLPGKVQAAIFAAFTFDP